MKTLIEWWADHKKKAMNAELDNICSDFKVSEKDGKIFLTYQGVAFAQIDPQMDAREIAWEIKKAREAAIAYSGLNNK